MSCNCNNPTFVIDSCAPYASLNSVQDAFNNLVNPCCLGTLDDSIVNPLTDPANAVLTAFPTGLDTCCDCHYIRATNSDLVYISCDSGDTWRLISDVMCYGELTTVGLNPSVSPVASTSEAFPLGVGSQCQLILVRREDGNICYSNDGGLTYSCQDLKIAVGSTFVNPLAITLDDSSLVWTNYPIMSLFNGTYYGVDPNNIVSQGTTPSDMNFNAEGAYIIRFDFEYSTNYQTVPGYADTALLVRLFNNTTNLELTRFSLTPAPTVGDAQSRRGTFLVYEDFVAGEDYRFQFAPSTTLATVDTNGLVGQAVIEIQRVN